MIEIYISGICPPNSLKNVGGWGFVLFIEMGKAFGSGSLSYTNLQEMELTACINALTHLIQIKEETDRVIIYTSSRYLWNGVNRYQSEWQNNKWKNEYGKDIKYKHLWIEVFELISYCFAKVKYLPKDDPSLSESNFLAMQAAEEKNYNLAIKNSCLLIH